MTKLEQLLASGEQIGIYVHDEPGIPYSLALASGTKALETRNRDTLKQLVGHSVYIISTKNAGIKPYVVGKMTICGKHKVGYAEFRSLYYEHQVPSGSKFDCPKDGYKWCYLVRDAQRLDGDGLEINKVTQTYAVISKKGE